MKKTLLIAAVCILTALKAFATDPINAADNCTDPGITDITSPNTTLFTTANATLTDKEAASPGSNDDDVWFKFTTATFPIYKIELSDLADHTAGGFPPSMTIEIWDGCGSTHYVDSTFGKVLFAGGLLANHTYYIRVYTLGVSQKADFRISATGINRPANDDCATAATLSVLANCNTGTGPFSTEGATASSQPSGDAGGKDDDVWFKFTTGTTNLYTKVSILNPVYSGTNTQSVIELWNNCGDASNAKFTPFSTSAILDTLLPNTTYYIRIYTYSTGTWLKSFNICVSSPPVNDSYFNATPITINTGNTCTTALTGGTTSGAGAEPGGPSCNSGIANDVWYKFVATTTQATIQITNKTLLPGHTSTNAKLWIQAYKGSNTAPSALCSGFDGLNYDGSSPAQTLEIGQTYYLRIYPDDPGNAFTFNICTQAPPPPVYDECSHAVTILPSTDGNCGNSIQLSNLNATVSNPDGGCLGSVGSDIWLKFTAPDYDNITISLSGYEVLSGSSNPLFGIGVYQGTCGAQTLIKCGLGKNLTLPNLTHGAVYYIRIMAANVADQGKITICVHGQPAAVTDTDCMHAVELHVGAESNTDFIHSSTAGVATDTSLKDCAGHSFVFSKALWFKFTAAATSELIDIENIIPLAGNQSYIGYKVYTGDGTTSCTGISVTACTADVTHQNNVITSLVPGNVYFVQVLLNGYNGDDALFNIRVINTAAPHNNEANHADNIIENPVYRPDFATEGTFRFSTLSTAPDAAVNAAYAGDVWYKFIAATQEANIRVDYGGFTAVQAYGGSPTAPAIYTSPATNAISHITGLTVGTTYYIRLYNPAAANSTLSGSVFKISVYGTPSTDAAAVIPTTSDCVGIDGGFAHSTASQKWLHLTTSGKMVASIFDDANMGTITAGYYINTGALRQTAGHISYLDRNFSLTPSIHPATPVKIIFYFTKDEFDKLSASANGHVNFLNDLSVAAFGGASCSNSISVSGESDYAIMGYGNLSDNVYYIEVNMPHFSGFFLKSSFGVTLPVTCNTFTTSVKDAAVRLSWQTASETNTSRFDIQRSDNGVDFTTIGNIMAAGQSSTARYYNYTDAAFKRNGTYYYRLNEFDKDDQNRFVCGVQKVVTGTADELFGTAYPNPAVNNVTINIQKAYNGKVGVQVINVLGQVISQKNIDVNNTTQIIIPTSQLPAGAYSVRLVTKDAVYIKQFSKVK